MEKQRQTILSGTTATGNLSLGNYIGAVLNWKKMQEDYDCFFFIADLHALTIKLQPEKFRKHCLSFFAQYLALGLDAEKNTLFVQSHIHEHTELAWLLTCLTPMGHLNRMTQYKEKIQKNTKNINAGLFTYPILMAADILLYRADLVPVGEDQRQHLELCRDIVTFFENTYGEGVFKVPSPYIPQQGARIMSLTNPKNKMSKSDENEKSYVALVDSPKKIQQKIKAAVTDSDTIIDYNEKTRPGLANLLTIYSILADKSIEQIVADYEGKMYGHLKSDLADLTVETLTPYRKRYEDLMKNEDYLKELMKKGKHKAQERASATLKEAYSQIGLVDV